MWDDASSWVRAAYWFCRAASWVDWEIVVVLSSEMLAWAGGEGGGGAERQRPAPDGGTNARQGTHFE